MKKIFGLTTAVTLAFSLAACSSGSGEVDVTGTWGEPDVDGAPSLVFEADGNVHGTDGCNQLMGNYELNGSEVDFGLLASTMMFCEGVDDWLSQANTAQVSNSQMHIFDEAGTEIGVLNKN